MRRKDREIKDFQEILKIMNECDCVRLGLVDDEGFAYIVPVNFAIIQEEKVSFVIHGSNQGKKADLLRKQQKITFEMDTHHKLYDGGDNATNCTYYFSSIMGKGTVSIAETDQEKLALMNVIMQRYTKKIPKIMEKMVSHVFLAKITIDEWSCKQHTEK